MITRIVLVVMLVLGLGAGMAGAVENPEPGLPSKITAEKPPLSQVWRDVRQGESGHVNNFPNAGRGTLIQSEGESWRAMRNGWLAPVAASALALVLVALAAFYAIRGKIKIDGGPSGRMILRFQPMERFGHWLTAGSFLVLGVTGLNILYGRYVLEPVIGKTLFAWFTIFGKWLHNLGGFVFIAGMVLILYLWGRENLWDRYDWNWIKHGGGLLKKGDHPPAAKFNFGQKTQFWMVIVAGTLVSATGISLLFPFVFADLGQQHWIQLLHSATAVAMIMAIMGHIYIGTVGMEGASTAVTTGYVDEAWAKEHHAVWVAEIQARDKAAE